MNIGKREFDTKNHTYIMGILNITPDSFSDGGRFKNLDSALFHAQEMIQDGADILDIGGESTRPEYEKITVEQEIERIAPVMERLRQNFDIPLSIDTYKSAVAKAALDAGADMVNDIWGLKYDAGMAGLIARRKVPCCLTHNRKEALYEDFLSDFMADMKECVQIARKAGIEEEKIILDPGVGFGKNYEMNLEIIREVGKLRELGYPILLGASRKSVIGLALDLPISEREEGTLAVTVYGLLKGCSFIRVHDVKANKRAVRMMETILRKHAV